MTDVPGVSRLQHGLLAVCDDVAERLAAPRRFRRRHTGDAAVAYEELGGRYLEITARPPRDAGGDEPAGHELDQTLHHHLDDGLDDDLDDDLDEYGPGDDPDDDTDRPDRREVRRRERETARRLRALQEQVRRTPVPDSPVEDDAAPPAAAPTTPAIPAIPASDGDSAEGARILPFPPRP
jgi:hypothetical protein